MQAPSPRFAVWLVLLIGLIAILLNAGKKLELSAKETGYEVSMTRILNKANYYKELWILNKQPQTLIADGDTLYFNSKGWLLPLNQQEFDCQYWFRRLNDKETIFGQPMTHISGEKSENGYVCTYSYKNQNAILLSVDNHNFSVSVRLSSKQ